MGSVLDDGAKGSASASFVFRFCIVITTAHTYDQFTLRCRGGDSWWCQQSQQLEYQGTGEQNQLPRGADGATGDSAAVTAAAGVSTVSTTERSHRTMESRRRSCKDKMYNNYPCCVSDCYPVKKIRRKIRVEISTRCDAECLLMRLVV